MMEGAYIHVRMNYNFAKVVTPNKLKTQNSRTCFRAEIKGIINIYTFALMMEFGYPLKYVEKWYSCPK